MCQQVEDAAAIHCSPPSGSVANCSCLLSGLPGLKEFVWQHHASRQEAESRPRYWAFRRGVRRRLDASLVEEGADLGNGVCIVKHHLLLDVACSVVERDTWRLAVRQHLQVGVVILEVVDKVFQARVALDHSGVIRRLHHCTCSTLRLCCCLVVVVGSENATLRTSLLELNTTQPRTGPLGASATASCTPTSPLDVTAAATMSSSGTHDTKCGNGWGFVPLCEQACVWVWQYNDVAPTHQHNLQLRILSMLQTAARLQRQLQSFHAQSSSRDGASRPRSTSTNLLMPVTRLCSTCPLCFKTQECIVRKSHK